MSALFRTWFNELKDDTEMMPVLQELAEEASAFEGAGAHDNLLLQLSPALQVMPNYPMNCYLDNYVLAEEGSECGHQVVG